MTTARRWYERALGAALVLVGLIWVLALALVWVWVRHEYTVGLSVDFSHALPAFVIIAIAFGLLAGLGGVALLRRP